MHKAGAVADIPRLPSRYREGELLPGELVTTEYKLTDAACDDVLAGRIVRGVVRHQHQVISSLSTSRSHSSQ